MILFLHSTDVSHIMFTADAAAYQRDAARRLECTTAQREQVSLQQQRAYIEYY